MDPERKIHSNSILKNLPAEKQAEIMAYIDLPGGHSLIETSFWLKDNGIHATPEMVSRFRDWYMLLQEFKDSEEWALDITRVCIERGWVKNAREERAAAQTFFNRAVLKQRDPKLWSLVERVNVLKDKVDLDEKKLKFALKKLKYKTAGGKKPAEKPKLTPDEKQKRIRQILGTD